MRILLIASRELKATVFTWAFVLSILMVPATAVLMVVALPWIEDVAEDMVAQRVEGQLVVLDAGSALTEAMAIEAEGDEDYAKLVLVHEADTTAVEAVERVRAGELVGVVEANPQAQHDVGERSEIHLASAVKVRHRRPLQWLVARAEARLRAEARDLDVEDVRGVLKLQYPEINPVAEEKEDELSREEQTIREAAGMLTPMMGLFLMWLSAFVGAQYLLQNTMEERSSRVMEVLLGAVSPMELMTGKIIGLGMVGALVSAAYGGTLALGLLALALYDLVTWIDIVLFGIFYVMAYLMVGSVFAAIGSVVTEMREAQSLMTPAVLGMTVPFLLLIPMMDAPNGTVAVVSSYVPVVAPFTMTFRVLAPDTVVPLWQLVTSLIWGSACTFFMLWACAKVFRIGVLVRGKPPSFLELLRWIRQG